MGLIKGALQRPITVLVIVAGLFFFGINAIRSIKIDIFPNLNLPVIYISHPYGGYTPDQMEGYFGKQYVGLLLYVSGVKSIETKNITGLTLIKLTFYEGTNMAQAAAEVTAYANRAQASFPPGSQPPFILRFDASTLPVGQLVLTSATGLALLMFRDSAAMGILLIVHVATVLTLFLTLPYGKFVHGLYRVAALIRYARELRSMRGTGR